MTLSQERSKSVSALGVTLMSASLLAFGITEIVMRLLISTSRVTVLGRFAAYAPGTLLLPSAAVMAYFASRQRGRGLGLFLAVSIITLTIVFRFRGVYIWAGTFDAYWLSPSGWLYFFVVGGLIGSAIGLLRPVAQPLPQKAAVIALAALAILALCNFAVGRIWTIDSVYAETRSIALAAMFAILAAALIFETKNQ